MYSIKLTQIAADYIASLDQKSQALILEKIEILKSEPLKVGKPLKGNLQGIVQSVRSDSGIELFIECERRK